MKKVKYYVEEEINKLHEGDQPYLDEYVYDGPNDSIFKAGVEFAESKFEEIAIEFAEYLDSNDEFAYSYNPYDKRWFKIGIDFSNTISDDADMKIVFKQFIKERNEKS